jgi:hypothetical protein
MIVTTYPDGHPWLVQTRAYLQGCAAVNDTLVVFRLPGRHLLLLLHGVPIGSSRMVQLGALCRLLLPT